MYQMSSDEDESGSPVLPMDSDEGSSVSSELQEEYKELLRYAVITPKVELFTRTFSQQLHVPHLSAESQTSKRQDETKSQHPAAKAKDGSHSSRSVGSSRVSPVVVEPTTRSGGASKAVKMAGCSYNRMSLPDPTSEMFQRGNDSSNSLESRVLDMFITEENINKMENILDSWTNNLKISVLEELQRWKIEFEEQHELEMKKEKEKFAIQTASLMAELDSLKEMVRTYEAATRRKDEVVKNMSDAMDKQREKLEKMKAFTQWRFMVAEAKEEARAFQVAEQHYNHQLKKRVWYSWHYLIQSQWRIKIEKACRTRAEEVCTELSTNYENKMAEQCEALEAAQAEIQRLRLDRERYEQAAKKAVMRGLCAFNVEALSVLNTTDGWPEQMPGHNQHDPPPPPHDDHGGPPPPPPPPPSHPHQPYPGPSSHFSPAHYDRPDPPPPHPPPHHPPPPHHDADNMMSQMSQMSVVPMSRAELPQSTTIVHNPLPQEGAAVSYQQTTGRVITAVQQKPLKTVFARVTARPVASTAPRSGLQMTGVAPPMTSVSVERHHPVLQNTIGHHMAARFPRTVQPGIRGGRAARPQAGTCHVHSIKVVQ